MLSRTKIEVGLGLLLLSILIYQNLEKHSTFNVRQDPVEKSFNLKTQIEEDLQKALYINKTSPDYATWKQSEYSSEDVFKNILAMKSKEGWKVLCHSILKLKPEDLVFFTQEIARPEYQKYLPESCLWESKTHTQDSQDFEQISQSNVKKQIHLYFSPFEKRFLINTTQNKQKKTFFNHVQITVNPYQDPLFIKGNLKQNEFALTFAIRSPLNAYKERILHQMLKTFSKNQIFTTFFITEKEILENPSLFFEILSYGHSMGILNYTKNNAPSISVRDTEKQTLKTKKMVLEMLKTKHTSWRRSARETFYYQIPPIISFDTTDAPDKLHTMLRKNGLIWLSWNIDANDWKLRNPKTLFKHLLSEMKNNGKGVIRFQDINEQTAIILPKLLNEFKKKEYKNVSFLTHPSVISKNTPTTATKHLITRIP
ncbi:MAG: polysaccharide deacetylase family protein [Deltaproteobacteria bacterium]|nr:polysaccharide deacetylase family protein [Deltaproteobacteria bacterium]